MASASDWSPYFWKYFLRDPAEHAGEACGRLAVFRQIRSTQQVLADFRSGVQGHLLDADHEHDLRRRPAAIELDALMHGGRTSGTGILDAGGGLEAQWPDRPAAPATR